MFKKIVLSVVIFALVASFVPPMAITAQAAFSVLVAEGSLNVNGMVAAARAQAKIVCEDEGGYFKVSVPTNSVRFEIDENTGQVAGLGKVVISYSQKCSGEPTAKLLKGSGDIHANFVFSGSRQGSNISGQFDLGLTVPAVVSLSTTLRGQKWQAKLSGSNFSGSFNVVVPQLGFYAELPFKITTARGQAKFISPAPAKQAQFGRDLGDILGIINSNNYDTREKGVANLKYLRMSLPFDKRPLGDIDPVPEISALLDIFNGYIACVEKNVQAQAIGNPQWGGCLFAAGDVLNRAEMYTREVRPPAAAAQFYLILSKMWDTMRYYSMYAPEKVKFDKVENCNRARQMLYKATQLDRKNEQAKQMLEQLNGKGGCDGMPLFGINQEQIDADKQKAIDEAMKKALEEQANEAAKKQAEFERKLNEAIDSIEEVDEEEAEENTAEAVEKGGKEFDKNLANYLNFVSDMARRLSKEKKEEMEKRIKEAESVKKELDKTTDAKKKRELEEKLKEEMRAMKEANEAAEKQEVKEADMVLMAKDIQNGLQNVKTIADLNKWLNKQKYFKNFSEFTEWMKKNRSIGEVFEGSKYGGFDAFSDAAGMLISYLENREKFSEEDAALKTFMDGAGMMLLNRLPVIQAAELVAKGPAFLGNTLLNMASVSQDSEIRLFLQSWADTYSPANALGKINEYGVTKTWTDIGGTVVYAWGKVGDAEGAGGTANAIYQATAATVGATTVAAAKGVRDIFYYAGAGIGQGASWLVGKFGF